MIAEILLRAQEGATHGGGFEGGYFVDDDLEDDVRPGDAVGRADVVRPGGPMCNLIKRNHSLLFFFHRRSSKGTMNGWMEGREGKGGQKKMPG